MVEMVHVVPGEGRLVKLPGRQVVPAEGVICERTQFIERRLACGDLVMPKDQSAAVKAPTVEAPTVEAAGAEPIAAVKKGS
jgi:hypothetical protein